LAVILISVKFEGYLTMRTALIALMLMFGSQAGADVFDKNFKLRKVASIGVSL